MKAALRKNILNTHIERIPHLGYECFEFPAALGHQSDTILSEVLAPGDGKTGQHWTALANGPQRGISQGRAARDIESLELGAVLGQAVERLVRQSLAGGQVQVLYVTAGLGKSAESRVSHVLDHDMLIQ